MRNRLSLAFLFSGALLVACSDDDSFIQRPSGGLPAEVADKAELETYECSMDVIGEKVYVVDLGENYECDGDEWFRSYDQPKSSSSAKSSSSVTPKSSGATGEASPCSALPGGDCNYGTLTDSRDGQTYKTVTIGDQVWMAQNLNYDPGDEIGSSKDDRSDCYNNLDKECSIYGRLYTWSVAVDTVVCSVLYCNIKGPIQGICPDGWHLPSREEWNTLFDYVGGADVAGTKLKAKSGWNEDGSGDDIYGFAGLPGGNGVDNGIFTFDRKGESGYFWSSSESDNYTAYSESFGFNFEKKFEHNDRKNVDYSVRCLKDSD